MTLYEKTIKRDSSLNKNRSIMEAYDQILMNEMKMTFIDAVKILATGGGEDEAWKLAQKDQGLKKGTTKEEWLAFAYKTTAYKKIKKGKKL